MTNKTLLLIFLFFVFLYIAITRLLSSRGSDIFDTALIQIDTSQIASIEIYPQSAPSYTIHRTEHSWVVSNGSVNVQANSSRLHNVLSQIDTIYTFRKVSDEPSDWELYGLGQKQASRIKIYSSDQLMEDFFIGRTDFDNELQKSIAYIRITGQNEIFAVNGFLPFQLEKHFNEFRNKRLFSDMDAFPLPDSGSYQKLKIKYPIHFSQGLPIIKDGSRSTDSLLMFKYWNQLKDLKGQIFADDFDELSADRFFHQRISFYYPLVGDSILLSCYRDSTRQQPFIIHSSQNPRSYFASDSTGLFQLIFEDFQRIVINSNY